MSDTNQMLKEVQSSLNANRAVAGEVVTLPDVLLKTAGCLGGVILAAVPGWLYLGGEFILYFGLLIVTMIVGVLLAKKAPINAPMALGYSALLGLIVGAFSRAATSYGQYAELIPQAVLGTVCGAVGMVILYSTPFGKKASKAVKLFAGLAIGYFLLSLVSLFAALFAGTGGGWGFYGVGGLGAVFCLIGVALATWSFLIDVGRTSEMITSGAPESYSWTLGVSLAASLVWMYLEILRMLAILTR